MKRALAISSSFAVAFTAATFHASPAFAGDIFAVIWITNNTNTDFCIPDGNAHVDGVWNPQGTAGGVLATSDGSPARVLGHGQAMSFGSKANGGIWPSGTGGSLTIPLQPMPANGTCPNGTTSANFSWSAPWSYFNGAGGSCDAETSISQPDGYPTTYSTRLLSSSTDGSSTFLARFEIDDSRPAGPTIAGDLLIGQSMPRSTAHNHVTSTDGSTTLSLADDGSLYLYDHNNGASWSNHNYTGVLAMMGSDGNFVVFDLNDRVVWSSGTSGHPRAFLGVTPALATIGEMNTICVPSGNFKRCTQYETSLYTMQAVLGVNQ